MVKPGVWASILILLFKPGCQTMLNKPTKPSILVLAHSAAIGGAELALASLMASTQDQYAWHIVFADVKKAPTALSAHASSTTYLDLPWWCHDAYRTPQKLYRPALQQHLATLTTLARDADILLTNTMTVPWLGLIAHTVRKPHIWYVHEYGDSDHHYQFVMGYDQSLALIDQCAQRVLTISYAVKAHLARIINASKIDLIHQAVDVGRLTCLPVTPTSQPIRLLALGGVKPSKGQLIALQAAGQLQNVTLDIVGPSGDDAYVRQLQHAAASARNVTLQVRAYNVASELQSHDAVLMCSDNEALGRVTLEALAAGKRVIGYACSATRELLADGRGVLYAPNTPEALAQACRHALEDFCLDVDQNRRYVTETYGANTQAADFAACVACALTSPLPDTAPSVQTYVAQLETRALFIGWPAYLRQQGRRQIVNSVPTPFKKLLKKSFNAFRPACYAPSIEN